MTVNNKKTSVLTVIVYLVVFFFLVAGLFSVFALIGRDEYSINVTYSDGSAFYKDNLLYLSSGQEAAFTVELLAKNGKPVGGDFSVNIVPANADDAEVSYRLGESIKTLSFSDIENFNTYFSLEKNENGFSIVSPENFSVEDAIKYSNPEKTVTLLSDVNLSALHFKAVVTSYDGEKVAEIYLDKFFGVEDVLTDSQISFGGIA